MKLSRLQQEGRDFEEPVWNDYGADMRVLVKAMGNREYEEEVSRVLRARGPNARRADPTDRVMVDAMKQAMAKHVLVGWFGLEDDDGEPIKYTADAALRLLQENHKFFSDIREIATRLQNRTTEEQEATKGNSGKSSSGASPGGQA